VQVARAPVAGGPQHFVPPLPDGPPAVLLDLGLTCAAMGATPRALAALRAAATLRPDWAPAWRKLAELLAASGDFAGAAAARQAAEAGDEPHPQAAVSPGKLAKAEQALVAMLRGAPHLSPAGLLRGHLLHHPRDAAALRILAEYILLEREPDTAEALLQRAVELAPAYRGAREDLVRLLAARARWISAEPHVAALLKADPKHEYYRLMDAELRNALGDAAAAVLRYEAILAAGKPREPRIWLSYGHALRDGGRRAEAVAAYHKAIAAVPEAGESYYSITNLKVGKPAPEFIAAMRAQLAEPKGSILDRVFLHFGLGQALEQTGAYGESFAQYAAGARLRLENPAHYEVNYGADVLARRVAENRAFFCAPRLAVQASGCFDAVPIFIIGMPRSGSTLLEQILASHPEVEATQELPELPNVILDLAARTGDYPGCLDAMGPEALAELGQNYIAAVRKWRQTDRPYVVDKMLGNWMQIGFIHKILPQAKIIDTRRHPMAACFGTFKQLIIGGEHYTYSLKEIAGRYRGYVELVAHYEALLPGRVHRVIYEDMVEDTERHIRAMLAYCGLPFDPACLRFWETERSIRTPSSEQVRQPIYRAGLDQWRNFEPWLDELRQALGDLPQTYRLSGAAPTRTGASDAAAG
jgi:tetratricopeptide (TPR) repeat protein